LALFEHINIRNIAINREYVLILNRSGYVRRIRNYRISIRVRKV